MCEIPNENVTTKDIVNVKIYLQLQILGGLSRVVGSFVNYIRQQKMMGVLKRIDVFIASTRKDQITGALSQANYMLIIGLTIAISAFYLFRRLSSC